MSSITPRDIAIHRALLSHPIAITKTEWRTAAKLLVFYDGHTADYIIPRIVSGIQFHRDVMQHVAWAAIHATANDLPNPAIKPPETPQPDSAPRRIDAVNAPAPVGNQATSHISDDTYLRTVEGLVITISGTLGRHPYNRTTADVEDFAQLLTLKATSIPQEHRSLNRVTPWATTVLTNYLRDFIRQGKRHNVVWS